MAESKVRLCIEFTTTPETKRDILGIEVDLHRLVTNQGYEWEGTNYAGLHGLSSEPAKAVTKKEMCFIPKNGNYEVSKNLEKKIEGVEGIKILNMYSYVPLWKSRDSDKFC